MNKPKKDNSAKQKQPIPIAIINTNLPALSSFTYNKSDEEVEKFIKTFIITKK